MLGLEGLFAEEGENFERSNETSNCKPGLPQPPAKRAKCGLCGISNQGATCYLNSLLQTLFFTTEFRGISFGNGTKTRVSNREIPYFQLPSSLLVARSDPAFLRLKSR